MKKCLVMVTIIKLTQQDTGNCNIQNYYLRLNGLTDLTESLNLRLWCDDPSNEIQN